MKSQSQRVPIISPLEKNYELLENRDELDFTTDSESSFTNFKPEPTSFNQRNSVTITDKFDMKSTNDDLSPETPIYEDGALSSRENGLGDPYDQHFTIVGERDIYAEGFDEAELADLDTLDCKPWNQIQDQSNDKQQTLIFYPFPAALAQK